MTCCGREALVVLLAVGCGTDSPAGADGAARSDGPGAAPLDAAIGIPGDAAAPSDPHLLVLSADGEVAKLELTAPWPLVGQTSTQAPVASARHFGGRHFVVHPAPSNTISVLAASDLSLQRTIELPDGSDPRDIAVLDAETAAVSLAGRSQLLIIELGAAERKELDLSPLADADGNPDAAMIARCGDRLFIQLRRIDHTLEPAAPDSPVIAVVELEDGEAELADADPGRPGTQGVPLEHPPDFDMHADCPGASLHVVEPVPIHLGSSSFEIVDLESFEVQPFDLPDYLGQYGGFTLTGPESGWIIAHTEFGPSPSSHLWQFGPDSSPTGQWDTFAESHVDNLAYDAATSLLFFPDPCIEHCSEGNQTGLQVFDADTGERLTEAALDVGFPPFELLAVR